MATPKEMGLVPYIYIYIHIYIERERETDNIDLDVLFLGVSDITD